MQSILEQLDRQSCLVMYLADELPATDRAEMERRLAADDSLRAELEELREAQELLAGSIVAADEAQPLHLSDAAIERRVGRMIRQWQVDRVAEQSRRAAAQPKRASWNWMHVSATAAALLLGFLVWWGLQPGSDASRFAGELGLPGQIDDFAQPPVPDDTVTIVEPMPDFYALHEAEQDLEALAYLRTLTE